MKSKCHVRWPGTSDVLWEHSKVFSLTFGSKHFNWSPFSCCCMLEPLLSQKHLNVVLENLRCTRCILFLLPWPLTNVMSRKRISSKDLVVEYVLPIIRQFLGVGWWLVRISSKDDRRIRGWYQEITPKRQRAPSPWTSSRSSSNICHLPQLFTKTGKTCVCGR